MLQLTNSIKTKRVMPDGSGYTVVAGTSDLTSSSIDTAGYQGVRIIIGFGAITANAVTSVKAQQSAESAANFADLAGSAIAVADDDDNQIVVIDIFKPQERYVRTIIDRNTQNAVVDFMVVELYHPRVLPADTSDATVVATEKHTSPDEGTA
jgi:hypothetical protein